MNRLLIIAGAALLLTVWGCADTLTELAKPTGEARLAAAPKLPPTPYNYSRIVLPQHLLMNVLGGADQVAAVATDNTPTANPTTDAGATLGRVLFYDKNLSQNNTISCASCHQQKAGFSDPAKLSKGFLGGTTRRHSMGLTNARFYKRGRFFWDERAATLEEQVLIPFQDPIEMGMTLTQLTNRINAQPFYKPLFISAFGKNAPVTTTNVSKALAQFVRSLVSISSKYDEGRLSVTQPVQNFPNFSTAENNGKRLFFTSITNGGLGCVGCHSGEAFVTPVLGPTINGIDAVSTTDKGLFETFPQPRFVGFFKVPSLKNIGVTAPYMHDGRFATLTDVVNHYNSGIQNHINLGNVLKDPRGNPIRFNLTPVQKNELIAFLNTLTDTKMLADPKFSNPF